MSDNIERLAVVESKVENLEDSHKELLKLMHEVKDEMTKYKGFLGGIASAAGGAAKGTLAGAAIANSYSYPYYGGGYYYAPQYYYPAPTYYYAPGYYYGW